MNDVKISVASLSSAGAIHPLTLFIKIARLLDTNEVTVNTDYDSLVYSFEVSKTNATSEFCEALNLVSSVTGENSNVKCLSGIAHVSYICSKKGNECLRIISYSREYLSCFDSEGFKVPTHNEIKKGVNKLPNVEIHIYDDGKAWNFTRKDFGVLPKGFPCSMKDFFYYQEPRNVEHKVFYALFKAWGEEFPIWNDLAEDFKRGCCYSSIPLDLIFQCHNRKELLERRYGVSFNRSNREDIGRGIFYARALRIVKENDLHKLFGFAVYPCYIGRSKKDMVNPLAYFIHEGLKNQFPEMKLQSQHKDVIISKPFIADAISMSIDLKKKIPVTFNSLNGVKTWHDDLAIIHRNKRLPKLEMPKRSRFRKLKLPDNCVRLTSRKMFIEEGLFQNNCVTNYIHNVNMDTCSIWSMRNADGTRYTIEIRINSNDKFYIAQMKAYDNEEPPYKYKALVEECIKKQEASC